MAKTQDVVIIGGGITGVAAAYELARAGAGVTLLEKGELASMASGWTLGGVRQSGRDPAEMPLAQAAVRRWQTLAEELDAEIEYIQNGNLRLARTPAEVELVAGMVKTQQALGLDLTFLPDTASVQAVAPALAETVLAASYCPGDGHANPQATVYAFASAAKRCGAKILTHTLATEIGITAGRVTGVQTSAGRIAADVVVIAAGVYSDRLLDSVGLALPLRIEHVSMAQTVALPPLLGQVLGVADGAFAGRQAANGQIWITAGRQPWTWPASDLQLDDIQPTINTLVTALETVIPVLPAFGQAKLARVWGGLLDMTPDALPVIEQTPEIEGLILAAGFSGHGFGLGPMSGQLICELATGQALSLPLDAFKRHRFAP